MSDHVSPLLSQYSLPNITISSFPLPPAKGPILHRVKNWGEGGEGEIECKLRTYIASFCALRLKFSYLSRHENTRVLRHLAAGFLSYVAYAAYFIALG